VSHDDSQKVNEAVNAEYTFLGTSFSGMKKRSPQGWVYGVPQESCTACLAAGCTGLATAFLSIKNFQYKEL
jgi:hypothetical protein